MTLRYTLRYSWELLKKNHRHQLQNFTMGKIPNWLLQENLDFLFLWVFLLFLKQNFIILNSTKTKVQTQALHEIQFQNNVYSVSSKNGISYWELFRKKFRKSRHFRDYFSYLGHEVAQFIVKLLIANLQPDQPPMPHTQTHWQTDRQTDRPKNVMG